MTYDEHEGVRAVPVLSREIVDRIGAGDAYLAITAPCAAAGYPMDLVGFIGNAVGALAVRIIGNRTPSSRSRCSSSSRRCSNDAVGVSPRGRAGPRRGRSQRR